MVSITNKDKDKLILKKLKYYKRHKQLDRLLTNCIRALFDYKYLISQREAPDYIDRFFEIEPAIGYLKEIADLGIRVLAVYGCSNL